ncbi:MAG TPA: ankyrin repeat domain-containing protein [Steroidobacteraceae bacterium]|nr:ankyrin repeat domain-containing protein [Steroidobacteraceae bacterium]
MSEDSFRRLIEQGDVDGVRRALERDSTLANRTVHWHLNQDNSTDPLHYVCDCVGQGWLTNGREGEIAELLLAHGAAIEGNEGRESPLIGAASLGADKVASVLIQAGANLEASTLYQSRALHWAAWTGLSRTVEQLVAHGAELEVKDAEFGATPLYWAVHGYGPHGPEKKDQVGAARILLAAGATARTSNKQGVSALELAESCAARDMYQLLKQYV